MTSEGEASRRAELTEEMIRRVTGSDGLGGFLGATQQVVAELVAGGWSGPDAVLAVWMSSVVVFGYDRWLGEVVDQPAAWLGREHRWVSGTTPPSSCDRGTAICLRGDPASGPEGERAAAVASCYRSLAILRQDLDLDLAELRGVALDLQGAVARRRG